MGFSVLAYGILIVVDRIDPALRVDWHQVAPDIPYLASIAGGALFALCAAFPANGILHLLGFSATRLRERAVDRYGNDIQRLLQEALSENKLVSITLDNRKIYIGLVSFAPTLAPNATHFSVIPFLSGYRDSSSLEVTFTTDYVEAYDAGEDPDQFRVALGLKDVKMASFFDPDVYPRFRVTPQARRSRLRIVPKRPPKNPSPA